VKDEEGNSVPDVDIQLFFSPRPQQITDHSRVSIPKTDQQGRWSYQGIPVSVRSVTAKFLHPLLALDPKDTRNNPSDSKATILFTRSKRAPVQNTLVLGGQIRGQVLNEAKEPITSATVRLVHNGGTTPKTNQWGWFQFPGSFAGPLRLLVTANGFAPRLFDVEVSPETAPLEIVLSKGNQVHFKIVDPAGTPIPEVGILAAKWGNTFHPPILEHGITYRNGEYRWMSSPIDAVEFMIFHVDYQTHQTDQITPRKEPYIITLAPSLVATFNVTNESAEPIEHFRIDRGRLFQLQPSSKIKTFWIQNAQSGFLGHSKLSSQQEISTPGTMIPNQYIYRIEALGYEPFETRIVDLEESPVTFDIQLKKRDGRLGVLTDLDDRPIPDESVRLITPSQDPLIKQGRNLWKTGQDTPRKTNSRGQFYIPSEKVDTWFLVASDEGFVLATNTGTEQQLVVQPWSKITGTVRESEHPVPGQRLGFRLVLPKDSDMKPPTFSDQAIIKADGSFAFNRVPPGLIEIFALPKEAKAPSTVRVLHSLELEPGSTQPINIDLDRL